MSKQHAKQLKVLVEKAVDKTLKKILKPMVISILEKVLEEDGRGRKRSIEDAAEFNFNEEQEVKAG